MKLINDFDGCNSEHRRAFVRAIRAALAAGEVVRYRDDEVVVRVRIRGSRIEISPAGSGVWHSLVGNSRIVGTDGTPILNRVAA